MKPSRWDDHYTRRAREEKWLARSVYKLQEIDRKFKLIRKGDRILDLGCYPGSWSQYGLKQVGPKGDVVGLDMQAPRQPFSSAFRFIQADVLTVDMDRLSQEMALRDVVLSDLAPPTTGIRLRDESRSLTLGRRALEIAQTLLKPKGRLVCKVFEGEDFKPFKQAFTAQFREIRQLRPKATRKKSREIYLVGLGRIGDLT